jgi:oligopeptide/dipeptide ABC transporter ATP-binding protein
MALLEIDNLATEIRLRDRTVHAVDGVSFEVNQGETLGLIGESGCGKTMIGMSVMGLLPPGGVVAGGQIRFDGDNLAQLSEKQLRHIRGNRIGMVFQDPMTSLNPTKTIGEQIAEAVRCHRGVSNTVALERAVEVLGLVGVPHPRDRLSDYPHQLSGGLRQRVMIAMALSCDPKLLIADEPTTALDVTIQAQILDLLDDLKTKLDMAMILITHDMGVIAGRADRVMVMYAGRIAESAETRRLFASVRHPYTEALLASIPQLDQDRNHRLYSIPGLPPDLTHPPAGCRFAARCRFSSDRCRAEEPVLTTAVQGHAFACFHPRSDPETGTTAGVVLVGGPAGESSESGPEPVLELRGVSKTFAVGGGRLFARRGGKLLQAVTDVSLNVRRGETLGIVGESGCGKTTLGRMMVDLEVPSSGEIAMEGTGLGALRGSRGRSVRRELQMMFQDPYASLDPRMRIGSIIAEPLVIQGVGDRAERRRRVAELIDEVGLPANAAQRYPHEFSGGQRQRVGLARALALRPKVIVADEPVSALDVSVRSQVLNLMKRVQADHDLTYVVISHDLSVVRYLADRIAVMYLGQLVEVGTGEDIYQRPAHPYTSALLSAIPVPDPAVELTKRGDAISGELPSPVDPPSGCRFRTRCPRAEDICAAEKPKLASVGGLHQAACHFPLDQPAVRLPLVATS